MTDRINNPLRNSLSEAEKPYYNAFISAMGRKPESMLDLMQGSAVIQQANKDDSAFWNGVFGL